MFITTSMFFFLINGRYIYCLVLNIVHYNLQSMRVETNQDGLFLWLSMMPPLDYKGYSYHLIMN